VAAQDAAVEALLAAMKKREKSAWKALRPGATAADLEALGLLGAPGPLLALLAAHDGSEDPVFGPYMLLGAREIQEERAQMNELLAATPAWQQEGRWKAAWVPFLADGDGQYLCFDPEGGTDGGPPGQIVEFDHETGPRREFASFAVFLELATALAKKGLLLDEAREEARDAFEDAYARPRTSASPGCPRRISRSSRRRWIPPASRPRRSSTSCYLSLASSGPSATSGRSSCTPPASWKNGS
jgi:cell wall assembly regulator SMI1